MNLSREKFQEYAELKRQQKEIEAKLDELQPVLLKEMADSGNDKVDAEFGVFTRSGKKKWKYSDGVNELEAQLKDKKKDEQADGTATFEESTYLTFREPTPAGHVVAAGAVAQEV